MVPAGATALMSESSEKVVTNGNTPTDGADVRMTMYVYTPFCVELSVNTFAVGVGDTWKSIVAPDVTGIALLGVSELVRVAESSGERVTVTPTVVVVDNKPTVYT